jgi:hypothetical protein
MTLRRFLVAGILGCLVVASAVIWHLRPTSITRTQFDAIAEGMTWAEVGSRLGGPPRNECPDDVIVWVRRQGKRVSAECVAGSPPPRVLSDAGDEEAVWVSEEGLIAVRFGEDGRLREKYFSTVLGPKGSRLELAFRRTFGQRATRTPAKAPASGVQAGPTKLVEDAATKPTTATP